MWNVYVSHTTELKSPRVNYVQSSSDFHIGTII
jgi:hypothetical protein